MSWSLRIAQGDLALGGNRMDVIEGGGKTVQDLACCILEPMGTDPMHPWFGSIINGGIQTDGNYNPGVIGLQNNAYSATFVDAEIRRIITQYQGQQAGRNADDTAVYGKSTLTIDEIILATQNIAIVAAENHMLVEVQLQTGISDDLVFTIAPANT